MGIFFRKQAWDFGDNLFLASSELSSGVYGSYDFALDWLSNYSKAGWEEYAHFDLGFK
jgi:hypothetical protein